MEAGGKNAGVVEVWRAAVGGLGKARLRDESVRYDSSFDTADAASIHHHSRLLHHPNRRIALVSGERSNRLSFAIREIVG